MRNACFADSSQHVCIEDCYFQTGDDAISIKSGWDEYGISFGMPSKYIHIQRIVSFPHSAGISFGSEMSGGISDVQVRFYSYYYHNYFTDINPQVSYNQGCKYKFLENSIACGLGTK